MEMLYVINAIVRADGLISLQLPLAPLIVVLENLVQLYFNSSFMKTNYFGETNEL
jgi:hypothetical protein